AGAVAGVAGGVVLARVEAVGPDAACGQRDDDDQQRDQRRDPAEPPPGAATAAAAAATRAVGGLAAAGPAAATTRPAVAVVVVTLAEAGDEPVAGLVLVVVPGVARVRPGPGMAGVRPGIGRARVGAGVGVAGVRAWVAVGLRLAVRVLADIPALLAVPVGRRVVRPELAGVVAGLGGRPRGGFGAGGRL